MQPVDTQEGAAHPEDDVLVLRPSRMSVLLTAALMSGLALVAGIAMPDHAAYALLAGVVIVVWTAWQLRTREQFILSNGGRTLETPAGHSFSLQSIEDVHVSEPAAETRTSDVMIHLGNQRWVPIFVGDPEVARSVAQFVERGLRRNQR